MIQRKGNRIKGYDYSQSGVYFLTACTENRVHWFGKVENKKMILNEFGQITEERIKWLELQYPYFKIHNYIVMPNHVHILCQIKNPYPIHQHTVGTGRDLSEKENQYLSENEPVGTNRDLSEKNNNENHRTGHDLSLREMKNDSDEYQRTGHDLSLRVENEDLSINTFAPIDILDYIDAVLHCPTYREKYKEFLKIDFPRVPYPHTVGTNRDLSEIQNKFWQLVKLGGELRQIHLLESAVVEHYITQYPIDGNNEVVKPVFKDGSVYINDTQYFANVPEVAWNFYIGGYQPAQKWLKDRKGRKLDFDDIFHYQKIIVALTESDRIMKEIDEIGIE